MEFEGFNFPDGTFHIKMPDFSGRDRVKIQFRGLDFLKLATMRDAVRNTGFEGSVDLFMPYLPGARQDRICDFGEPFTARVVADMINAMEFDSVSTIEPHSDVMGALIRNLHVTPLEQAIPPRLLGIKQGYKIGVVAPDAGAAKRGFKYFEKAKELTDDVIFVQGSKVRNPKTGQIEKIQVNEQLDPDYEYIVVDDVCAMGGTFKGLAVDMKEKGAKVLHLVLAHADVKNGLDSLTEFYDSIYVTNSQSDFTELTNKNINIIKVI